MVTSNTRKILPDIGVEPPSVIFFTAELSVTLKTSFTVIPAVDVIAVGAVVGARVVPSIPGAVVELRVCEGVVRVGGLLCTEP
jgi:hypothetical protein